MRYTPGLGSATLCAVAFLSSAAAVAGPYGDEMSKCLVNSTTAADRTTFIKWMFAAMALHPDVKSLALATDKQRDAVNTATAELIVKMLTETRRAEAQKAVRFEGGETLPAAFQIFGQVAGRELFTNPDVADALKGLVKYMDEKKLKELGAPPAATPAPAPEAQPAPAPKN